MCAEAGLTFVGPDGYTLFNWTARYRYKSVEAFVSIENLANGEWREAQFFFTSRLGGLALRF